MCHKFLYRQQPSSFQRKRSYRVRLGRRVLELRRTTEVRVSPGLTRAPMQLDRQHTSVLIGATWHLTCYKAERLRGKGASSIHDCFSHQVLRWQRCRLSLWAQICPHVRDGVRATRATTTPNISVHCFSFPLNPQVTVCKG